MTSLLSLVRRHQLTAFFSLTIGLTWLAFIPFYMSNGDSIPWFTFGPMVSGFVVAAVSGGWSSVKAILSAMVRWRVRPIWYLVAFGLPFGTQLASILINPMLGAAAPAWSNVPALSEMLPIIALYALFSGPLGEEPGWRGFATPRLLASQPALAGSLILGSSSVALSAGASQAKVQKFANCAALNKVYPHGVGKAGAHDHVRGNTKPVTNFTVNTAVYNANTARDRDKDGVACERRLSPSQTMTSK